MSKYPDLRNQKSVSKTFHKGDILSDDGELWISDALGQVSETIQTDTKFDDRVATCKYRITITKLEVEDE